MDRDRILSKLAALPGRIGFTYKNLATGESFGFHADELFEAASVIKLPVYAVLMKRAAAGELDMAEQLLCRDEDKKPSCGALQFFPGAFPVDVGTCCRLMITLSDNTATNLLLRRFGLDALNGDFRAIGLQKTHLERLLFDGEASARGLENRICPEEIGGLLESIAERRFVSPPSARRWNSCS